jgi:hypothetical protein
LSSSSRVGVRSSIVHRRSLTVRRVIQNEPIISATAMYAGHTTHVIQAGASLKTLGTGNATVTSISAAPMPRMLAAKMNTVRITWMRIRRCA